MGSETIDAWRGHGTPIEVPRVVVELAALNQGRSSPLAKVLAAVGSEGRFYRDGAGFYCVTPRPTTTEREPR